MLSRFLTVLLLSLCLALPVQAQLVLGLVPGEGSLVRTRQQAVDLAHYLETRLDEKVELLFFRQSSLLRSGMINNELVDLALLNRKFLLSRPTNLLVALAEPFHVDQQKPVPAEKLIAGKHLTVEQQKRLKKAFFALSTDPTTMQLREDLQLTGFRPLRTDNDQLSTEERDDIESADYMDAAVLEQSPTSMVDSWNGDKIFTANGIDLRQAEQLALENNLNLQIIIADTRAAEALVRKEYGIYDPQLTAAVRQRVSRDEYNLQYYEERSKNENTQFGMGITQLLPTGAELDLRFNNNRNKNTPATSINPAYDSDISLSLVQPLLKDFGRQSTEQNILFATQDRLIAIQDLRDTASRLIADVRNAFFDLLQLRDELDFRRASVDLAQRVLKENQARVTLGELPSIERLEADVALVEREWELLEAQQKFADSLDLFTLLIGTKEHIEIADTTLTKPSVTVNEENAFNSALEKRPDLLRNKQELHRLSLETNLTRNRMLPGLDLLASYGQKGLDQGYQNSLEEMSSDSLKTWDLGIRLSFSLGNRNARNDNLKARMQLAGQRTRLLQLQDQARKEIREAINLLKTTEKKLEVAERGQVFAQKKLDILLKRKEIGFATTRQLFEGETDLTRAKTAQSGALAKYHQAISQYLLASGELLNYENIQLTAFPDPENQGQILQMKRESAAGD